MKGKRSGPLGLAQKRIHRAVTTNQKLSKRAAFGRRTKKHRSRQKRDNHNVLPIGSEDVVKGKYCYFNWQTKESNDVFKLFNCDPTQVVDVSTWQVIDCASPSRHAVVRDSVSKDVVCAKVAFNQAAECMGGRKGLNEIRNSLNLLRRATNKQKRSKERSGMNTGYRLFGYRKNQQGKYNSEYVLKNTSNVSEESRNSVSALYKNLSHRMETAARRIGNSFYETGEYEVVRDVSNVPTVGVARDKKNDERRSFATALAVGENYWSKAHTDEDYYFSVLSALSKESKDNGKVLYYFIFPDYKIIIPVKSGDILLFNPTITHSCSNPSLHDNLIFSSYVAKETVLTAEKKMESIRLVDDVVSKILAGMK